MLETPRFAEMPGERPMNPEHSADSTFSTNEAPAERALAQSLPALGRTCMALLGNQRDAEASLEHIRREAPVEAKDADPRHARAAVFGVARRECARRLERRPSPAHPDGAGEPARAATPAGARALLAELYPSEREALVLRAVAALRWDEVAEACGTDEASAKSRASQALVRLAKTHAGRSDEAGPGASSACEELQARLVDVLDGTASDDVYAHQSECARCRDRRHEVERAFAVVAAGGDDFVVPRAEPIAASAPAVGPLPAAAAATTTDPRRARPGARRGWVLGGALAVAGVFALAGRMSSSSSEDARALGGAVVERVSGGTSQSGFAACAPSGSPCQTLQKGSRVPAGSRVKTDFSTRATLSFENGGELALERGSELVLTGNGAPELLRGSFVAEIRGSKVPAALALPQGSIRTASGKLAIRAGASDSVVEVARGTVEVEDRAGTRLTLRAGEQSRLGDGPPLAIAAPSLGTSIAWSERMQESREDVVPRGLGELAAKLPGAQAEQKGAVRLSSHRVRVRISGAVARTEVEEVFTNTTGAVLEGIYRFPLPPDSKIERLALEVDGKLMEGAFVERERAAAIWRGAIVNTAPEAKPFVRDEIVWVPGPWKDPALLEWQRGGRFELRIFPIPKHGSRRIVLAYTEVLRPAGDTRRYVYPLPHDPGGSTRVDHFDVDVQVRGHDPSFPVRASGYDVEDAEADDSRALRFSREGFAPSGDLTVEYALPERRAELSSWAYRPSSAEDASYVALALRPKLPRTREEVHRSFAIVVDSSRSMYGESYDRAKRIAARLVRELDPADRVTVLACDSDCAVSPDREMEPGTDAEERTRRFLDDITPDGASDPSRAQRLAYESLALGAREGRIVYIGDGAPTMGPIRPDHIEQVVARALPKERVRVTAVAVGTESDLETLSAVARGGGGVVLPYAAGQSVAEAAYDVLGAAYGRALRNVSVRLPDGLYAPAPARLDAIPAGGEMLLVARMRGARVEGDLVLTGDVGGERFERRYVLRAEASPSKGNAFVPRVYAALKIADLERDGSIGSRDEAVKLSTAFNVQSRFTSLLVLESQAMFRAFGLEQTRRAPEWSGEDDVEATLAEGELQSEPAKGMAQDAVSGSLGAAAPTSAAKPKVAKRSAASEMADPWDDEGGRFAQPPAPTSAPRALREDGPPFEPEMSARRRQMIPMRRIWERAGEVTTARTTPKKASDAAIEAAERRLLSDQDRRELTRELHALLAATSDLDRVEALLGRWITRDPFDPDALTARADLAARRGDRTLAIRLLGSVIDARPGDVGAQRRLERLHRWAGRAAIGCRHLIAVSELRPADAELLADAVRCSRATGEQDSVDRLLAAATPESRRKAEAILQGPAKDDGALRGDVRLEATWSGGSDVDLALVDENGARFSWLGAPTRQVIMARDVVSNAREALAVRGAKPGEYAIELVRSAGDHPVSGEIAVTVAGAVRRIPFQLSGTRATLGLAIVRMQPRLVPL